MSEMRTLPLVIAIVLLAACAAQKPSHPKVAPVVEAKPARTQPPKPHANHAGPPAAKSEGLPAREVGYYLDVLQGRLQQQLDPAIIVSRENDSIVLDLSRRLGFPDASAQLDEQGRVLLVPLAKILVEYRAALVSVRVSAEADDVSAHKFAQLRAGAIERALIAGGIAPARMVSVASSAARAGAIHVEIVLAPQTRGD